MQCSEIMWASYKISSMSPIFSIWNHGLLSILWALAHDLLSYSYFDGQIVLIWSLFKLTMSFWHVSFLLLFVSWHNKCCRLTFHISPTLSCSQLLLCWAIVENAICSLKSNGHSCSQTFVTASPGILPGSSSRHWESRYVVQHRAAQVLLCAGKHSIQRAPPHCRICGALHSVCKSLFPERLK